HGPGERRRPERRRCHRDPGGPARAEAEVVARADGAAIRACVIAGVIVTVEAAVPYHGWEASASARAGPPGSR
ncbi:hypothetical protein ACFFN3_20675, partial [Leifsonia shinshuensis]